MNLHLKSKILGNWENEEIKYSFYENNSMRIQWNRSNDSQPGKYYIDKDQTILFHYGDEFNALWTGKINYISSSELSITDLSNEVGKTDILYRNMPLKKSKDSNSKFRYILSRTLIVFL